MNKELHIVRILKGGSIIATESVTEGTGRLAGVKRFRGQRFQIPSLRYLVKDQVSDETADLIDTYLESLSVGGVISWATPTSDDVTVTQDRDGNTLDTPRVLNRKYADIDFDALDSALEAFVNPAPKTSSRRGVKAGA
jgi:hypothetical protein